MNSSYSKTFFNMFTHADDLQVEYAYNREVSDIRYCKVTVDDPDLDIWEHLSPAVQEAITKAILEDNTKERHG